MPTSGEGNEHKNVIHHRGRRGHRGLFFSVNSVPSVVDLASGRRIAAGKAVARADFETWGGAPFAQANPGGVFAEDRTVLEEVSGAATRDQDIVVFGVEVNDEVGVRSQGNLAGFLINGWLSDESGEAVGEVLT